jgi:hypothetical protein
VRSFGATEVAPLYLDHQYEYYTVCSSARR